MRRRDVHTLAALVAMLGVNVATAAGLLWIASARRRDLLQRVADLETRVASAERTCVDAAAATLALADGAQVGDASSSGSTAPAPVVLGYGQTRSRNAVYVYQDVRYEDGEVRRTFIERIPFRTIENFARFDSQE